MLTIALVGCSKNKNQVGKSGFVAARDLYKSDLFSKRVAHVERRKLPWYVLSGKSGILNPTTQIRSYDKTIADMTEIEIAEWHVGVTNQLLSELWYSFKSPKLSSVTIELHAGSKYCEPLASMLGLLGVRVAKPVEGFGIGEQLAYYSDKVSV